ncbi:uncharacterized protein LOC141627568 [Silene latifolia]|uniref:uncharacterized protein LOC141627568 n=1 Tax=Silene latifolia TaxID=37657 RepID=UPI003D773371
MAREKRQSRVSNKRVGNVHSDASQKTVNFTPVTSNVTELICSPTDVVERLVRDLCAEYGETFSEVIPECSRTQQNTSVPLNNDAWEGYWDCGDAEYECEKCNALMWFDERKDKRRGTRRPKFSLCCSDGKVELAFLQQPPELIKSLLTGQHRFSNHYRENIRTYNSMFSFTSMGGKIDHSINKGKGPYTFRMGGQNCHRIGTLVPTGDARPKFCQLYIYDTEEEVQNRKNAISPGDPSRFNDELIRLLENMIDSHNTIAKTFRKVRDRLTVNTDNEVSIKFISRRSSDGRTYNLPTVSEVAALIEGDIGPHMEKRDIIVRRSCGSYDPTIRIAILTTMLSNAVGRGDVEPSSAGTRFIVPSSFPGGDNWKKANFLDTMTIFVYTIEFQKRGLPHAHIVLFLHREDKFATAADVDKIISAEIPDPTTDPVLHSVVCEYMLHGPCGKAKPSCPCMVGGKCSKYYPKPCTERTTVDGDGYPIYKRSKKGVTVIKDDVPLGNDFVIPYNSKLLLKYRAHINIEWCNQSRSIKYLFKYINKGSNRVTMQSSYTRRNEEDPGRFYEIKRFYDCRYLSACEAVWRLFGFDIHYRTPAIERLQYHLPDEQPIVFHDDDWVDEVVEKTSVGVSQFLNWMGCNNSTVEDIRLLKNYCTVNFQPNLFGKRNFVNGALGKKDLQLLTDEELQNYALIDIENSLQINGSSLRRFEGMSFPNMSATTHHRNSLVMDALSYDRQSLSEEHEILLSSMTGEQRLVYNEVMEAALNNKGGVFFVYGYGGTGKTFLWRALCACFRSKGDIVVAVASSGIAATLIPGGVTAHSRFGISINVTEDSICSRIKPGSDLAELLIRAKLIIWDEAPITHRHCFEALDKSLKDVMRVLDVRNAEVPFGGKVVVFGGDFRQTLPVVSKGSRADVVAASLCSSYLWSFCTRCENDGEVDLELPADLLIQDVTNPIKTLVDVTYPDLLAQLWNPEYLQQRTILAPTHEIVESVNEYVLSLIKKDERIYLSSDEVCSDARGTGDGDIHSIEFLNSIKCAGLPNHQLKLKVGAMVMLLRNIDQSRGLCNGTRLTVIDLGARVIKCTVLTGSHKGYRVHIARLTLNPSGTCRFPVRFSRRQFPIAVCFAMTINKSQGQSLSQSQAFISV